MGGTVTELIGFKPSGRGIPAHDSIEVAMLVGEAFSEPILLAGRKVISIQAPALATTDISIEAANFSSDKTGDAAKSIDGMIKPLPVDFKPLADSGGSLIVITASDGDLVYAISEVGFAIWIRIVLSVPQTVTFRLSAKG